MRVGDTAAGRHYLAHEMQQLRNMIRFRGKILLAMVVAALGMNALMPAGYMIAPSAAHGFAVTLCPKSNPLAQYAAAPTDSDAEIDHAAMGHDVADAAQDDMGEGGHHGSSASSPKADCAFSAIAAAATLPEKPALEAIAIVRTRALLAKPQVPDVARRPYLQPPLRGPPILI